MPKLTPTETRLLLRSRVSRTATFLLAIFSGLLVFSAPTRAADKPNFLWLVAGESFGTLSYSGFWSMARKYWRTGAHEVYRSFSKRAFTKALQKLVPEIREEHLTPGGAGVRAQAVDRNGALIDDFRIVQTPGAVHVLNAPSPGATASLAISGNIVAMAESAFGLET